MNNCLKKKIESLALELIDCPVGKSKHFTFLLDKTKIISMGWSNSWRTHPTAKKLGYRFDGVHSELDAIIRSRRPIMDLQGLTVVNIRINSLHEFGMSHPCKLCMPLVSSLNPRNVFYTDTEGKWRKM